VYTCHLDHSPIFGDHHGAIIFQNSLSFLTITHTTLSAKQFRSYGILTIDVAAEFCIRTEQRYNGSSISSLGLAETPDVPNIVLEDNSLSFPMVRYTAPNG
jgi:hypothetical protein